MKKLRYLKSVFRFFSSFLGGIKCFHTIMYIIKLYKTSHPLGCKQQNVYWILFHSLWGIVLTNYFGSIANIGQTFQFKRGKIPFEKIIHLEFHIYTLLTTKFHVILQALYNILWGILQTKWKSWQAHIPNTPPLLDNVTHSEWQGMHYIHKIIW